ncbi:MULTISPECIES: DUF6993 domain-containing protein [unclassified Rathayibacter]|uniref:DUF6993 domain-containing protein n=1 Tax=unclassified Rathayibacter TaxID=2609250 RepID=UPI000CE76346|nr:MULTISPECIES: hypothetical protein [unclassified Rathayibacter]PPF27449.1 hypothetical protein C5C54_09580 [Rathayibacter sp. AY1F2]PPH04169.1 hypothetical protein C5C44_08440 [Rathayibacter sp. AY1F6]PPH17356.1 hypothetical protein C5C35_06860 [Rathayibacter sp. AY1F8]PPH37199.1 hypothetical protein C5C53_07725 [Rathayibacter sp. AY1E3]PPH45335.1 hypothetical protein C5C42_09725 [Rathayibacter sp. AY1F7]
MTRNRAARIALVLGGLAVCLSGCTSPSAPDPVVSSSAAEAPAPAESAAPVAFVPGGTTEQNLPVFEQTLRAAAEPDPEVSGSSVVDALVAAGFSRESMQLTADETSVGLDADSVQVSVKLGESCLIGQYGPKSGGVRAVIAAPIATGACLVGRTVPIQR